MWSALTRARHLRADPRGSRHSQSGEDVGCGVMRSARGFQYPHLSTSTPCLMCSGRHAERLRRAPQPCARLHRRILARYALPPVSVPRRASVRYIKAHMSCGGVFLSSHICARACPRRRRSVIASHSCKTKSRICVNAHGDSVANRKRCVCRPQRPDGGHGADAHAGLDCRARHRRHRRCPVGGHAEHRKPVCAAAARNLTSPPLLAPFSCPPKLPCRSF